MTRPARKRVGHQRTSGRKVTPAKIVPVERHPAADHPMFEECQKKWKGSALTDAQAHALGLAPLTAEQVSRLGPNFKAAGGLLIPYFDVHGERTSFFRVRYLEKLPGFAGQVEKPQRYCQPIKTLNEIYMPPLLDRPWSDIARDTNAPIAITEGELKSASGCAYSITTIALGGVDMWRSKKCNIDFLQALDGIDWKNRDVEIVYDSDAATNPNVLRAQNQLARWLTRERQARVTFVDMPAAPDGSKQGLDDFLFAAARAGLEPREEYEKLLRRPYFEGIALHEMNEEVILIERPGLILAQRDGHVMAPEKFTGLHYADRSYLAPDSKGTMKPKPTASEWLKWPGRFKLYKITYRPGAPRVVEEGGHRCWNAWTGWGCEPMSDDVNVDLWTQLLDHMFLDYPEERRWFECWCAYPIQHPGTKLYTSVLLWGEETGTGKTFTGELLRKIYGENGVAVGKKELVGNFNSLFKNRQFVQGEEITGDERKSVADELKTLITQEEMVIHEKYLPEYVLPTCANYLFTSNHPDAFFLAGEDRRHFVYEVTTTQPKEFWERLHDWKEREGPAHLFRHLLDLDLGDFDPRAHAPMTAAKRAMIEAGKNDLQRWCDRLREGAEAADEALAHLESSATAPKMKCEIFTVEQLHRAFDPDGRYHHFTRERVGSQLAAKRFPQNRLTVDGKLSRYYAVRNPDQWSLRSKEDWTTHVTEARRSAKC